METTVDQVQTLIGNEVQEPKGNYASPVCARSNELFFSREATYV